ncbi:hypothetical protein LTS08_003415 [Lithohypha guttulata]|nr:hypothetical protein LTS08_003415 [Lithohypha guttulata]
MSNSIDSPCRVRSFRGCGTCRSRHIKCDEARPTCSTCTENGSFCTGYLKQIFFDDDKVDGQVRYRQLLFTDEERVSLNALMLQTIPFRNTSRVLAYIEDQCQATSTSEGIDIIQGPFGAFRLPTYPSLDDSLVFTSNFQLDSCTFDTLDWNAECLLPPGEVVKNMNDELTVPSELNLSAQTDDNELWQKTFENAPLLLKHYVETVIPMLTPMRHHKTPWHVLFLPFTKQTLATITIGQDADSPSLTTFFGTLALSALSLISQDERWTALAQLFQSRARECLQDTLNDALSSPKHFKYKHIIMAMLTMIQLSMADGSWDETDTLLIETEKIIRLRGLCKSYKSRKIRLLHHCYAYARIFQESISLTSSRSPLLLNLVDAVESSGVVVKGADTPFFGLSAWGDLELKFQELKTQEVGENDLHLASPGTWKATLYPEIFGVPETWLTLLSQIIRLANEKSIAEMDASVLSLKDFTFRAKALERYILQCNKSRSVLRGNLPDLMQTTLYSALAIYFYRRIYEVDAELLQARVVHVKEYLTTCQSLCNTAGMFDALMWPAFVAGCEAIDPNLQEYFSAWFDVDTMHNKLSASKRMRQLMLKVWENREHDDRNSCSWLQFLRS